MDKKYCTQCGTENELNAEYCINCGNGFNSEPTNNEENIFEESNVQITENVEPEVIETIPEEPKKKKKGKGCLITIIILLIIAGLVVGGIFLYKKLNFFEDPFGDVEDILNGGETTETKSLYGQLEEDLTNGKITKDQYIMQMAYSLYEPSMVSQEYKETDNSFNDVNYLLTKANEMANELSDETILYIYKKYMLEGVEWDVEDSKTSESSDASASVYDYKVEKMAKSNTANINKLRKAKLSKKGHFIVYYSNDGINAVTDSQAKKIANYLEKVVTTYKEEYNLDFYYSPSYNVDSRLKMNASTILIENNISLSYLDTAMPIYLIDIEDNTGVRAQYAANLDTLWQLKVRCAAIFMGDSFDAGTRVGVDGFMASYALPYFLVDSSGISDFDSTKFASGHELFHHYQRYICGDGEYVDCKAGLFTGENTADLSSYYVLKPRKSIKILNDHNLWYIQRSYMSIDKVYTPMFGDASRGYPAFIYSYNYAKIVPDGKNKLNQSLKETNALQYLYDSAGKDKYAKVMTTMAEKNLTNDYDSKALIPHNDDGSVIYPSRYSLLTMNILRNYSVDYSAIHYFYYDPWYVKDTLDHTQIKFQNSTNTDELYIVFFVKENGKYKKVYSQKLDNQFVVDAKEFLYYDEIAFAVVNTSASNKLEYAIQTGGNDELTVTIDSLNLKKPKTTKSGNRKHSNSSIICYNVENDEQYTTVAQVKISFDNNDEANDMYARGTVIMNNYSPDDPAYKIAKSVTSGLIFLLKRQYKKELGAVSLQTKDEGAKYIITAHVKKDYYKAISNSFDTQATTKEEIKTEIENQGYTCQYE